MKIIPGMRLAH